MTESTPTPDQIGPLYRDLRAEHRRLLKRVDSLGDPGSVGDLVARLEDLRRLAVVHFAHEQLPDGLYEVLDGLLKDQQGPLEALKSEHAAILAGLEALIVEARAAASRPAVAGEVARVAELLRDHERKEHELARSVLGEEASPDD